MYTVLNCIAWNPAALEHLPLAYADEFTYFVLPVREDGQLIATDIAAEKRFVKTVHQAGKLATISIAGGAQDVRKIETAVGHNAEACIASIGGHMSDIGYDGVVLDIENTAIRADVMADFAIALRGTLDTGTPGRSIGMYVQPYQRTTVFRELHRAREALDWVAPMIYDFSYTTDDLKAHVLDWLPQVGGNRSKLLAGVAVNYETGLDPDQFSEVLTWTAHEGLKGVGIWQNTLYAEPWRERLKNA